MSCPFTHFCGAACTNPSATHPGDGTAHIHPVSSQTSPGVSVLTGATYTAALGEKGWH